MKNYKDCPFCLRSIRGRTFYETSFSKAFFAKHSVARGQAIVIPKRHVERMEELNEYEISDLSVCCSRVVRILKSVKDADDFNIVINIGKFAGQTIEHLHYHIIPRMKGDIPDPRFWLSADLFSKLKENAYDDLTKEAAQVRAGLDTLHPIAQAENARVTVEWSKKNYIAHNVRFYGVVKIGKNCVIEKNVSIGIPTVQCDGYVYQNSTTSSVVIGNNSIIRSGTLIYEGAKIGDNFYSGHNVLIRDNTSIGKNVYVYSSTQIHSNVSIGNYCRLSGWLGNNTILSDYVSSFGHLIHKYSQKIGGVIEAAPIIMENAMIGWNAIIIGGVRVGAGASVGAGAVVTKDVMDKECVIGIPAKTV